jgi:hypothetical protein
MYYDWVNHTVLFSTVPDTSSGSAVSGSTAPGAHIVFTPVGGGRPMVVRSDSTGRFQSKLPPGNYAYRVEDSAGRALTTTPLSVVVKPNEPLQLPPMTLDGKASNNLGISPSGATGQPSEAQIPAIGVSAPTGSLGTVRDEKKKPATTKQQPSSTSNTDRRNNIGNEDSSKINASEGDTEGAIRGVTAAAPPPTTNQPATSLTAAPGAAGGRILTPVPPCCGITAIKTSTDVVTAKENTTGKIFQFKVNDATLLNSLTIGQGVYANFTAKQVSLNGSTAIGTIITGDTAYTGFDPTIHGFNFLNYFTGRILIDIPGFGTQNLGPTSYGLCGGMTYAALDNFISGGTLPNPTDKTAPVSGTPLRSYLYDRQHDTFVVDDAWMIRRFIDWVAHPDTTTAGITGLDVLSDRELEGNIRPQLAAGHPVPLGLVKANISVGSVTSTDDNVLVKNHQVLAIGYELHVDPVNGTHWDIRIYDPNHPDTIQRMHTHSNVAGYQTDDTGTQQTESFRGFFATPYSPKQPYWVSGGQPGHGVAIAEGTPAQAGAAAQTTSSKLVTGNPQTVVIHPDPNPNHLPDLVLDNSSSLSECSIPAGSSCQASCGSKKIPHNFGVHNLTQYPANGPIHIILTEIASGAVVRNWTVNGLGGNQYAYPGGFYTMWPCPTGTSFSNPPDNYTLEVQGPPELTTNNKIEQLYIPPDAVLCAGVVDWSGCQQ